MADQLESFVVVVLFDVESLSCITHVSSINMRKDKDQKVTPIEMYLNHNTYEFSIKTRSTLYCAHVSISSNLAKPSLYKLITILYLQGTTAVRLTY